MPAEEASFRVAFVPGVTVSKWARVWAERRPDVALALVPVDQDAQAAILERGGAQMAFVRLPIGIDSINVIPLYEERAFVVVPRDHPIALFDEVVTADLAGEELLTDAVEDAISLAAAGAGVVVLPQSIARLHGRKDVVARPVTDAPTTSIGLAWLADEAARSDRIEEFIGIVRGRTARSSRGTDRGSDPGKRTPGPGTSRAKTSRPPKSGDRRRRAR